MKRLFCLTRVLLVSVIALPIIFLVAAGTAVLAFVTGIVFGVVKLVQFAELCWENIDKGVEP